MKKTKIVCTIGPASETTEVLEQLIKSGMNVMRLNFSHGDHEEHLAKVKTLREINERLGTNVAFIQKVLKLELVHLEQIKILKWTLHKVIKSL